MDAKIKLTPAERVILIGQLEIKKMLKDPYDDDEKEFFKNCDELIEALEGGYEAEYSGLSGCLSDPLSVEDCNLVYNVLHMYEILNEKFPGFNEHNSENKYMAYASYLIRTEKIEKKQKVKLMANSNEFAMPAYKEALEIWHKMGTPLKITQEQRTKIFAPTIGLPDPF